MRHEPTGRVAARELRLLERTAYRTDLSGEEWEVRKPLVPETEPGGRPRAHETRELLDANF